MDKEKRIKVGIGIPTADRITPDFAIGNLGEILNYTSRKLPNVDVAIAFQKGVRTDRNRNEILARFLKSEMDYILWLDADMLYPETIIENYLQVVKEGGKLDVIGCLYFGRNYPFKPIGYTKDPTNAIKPYLTIPPALVKKGVIYPVAGLGFGGMMVNTKVYEKLGDKKWHNYGVNFHLPGFENPDALTHDLEFCKTAEAAGFNILMHGSVRPSHIGDYPVDERDFIREYSPIMKHEPDVIVMIPAKPEDVELANKAAKLMQYRAGTKCEVKILEDKKKEGYVAMVNKCFKETKADLYVWTSADAFPGKDWLKEAVIAQAVQNKGLMCLNNGRWDGILPAFAMITRKYAETVYNGEIFYHKYFGNYCDTELGQIAKQEQEYGYAEKSIMLEIDYTKQFDGQVNKKDQSLFKRRKKTGFGNKVFDKKILEEFI